MEKADALRRLEMEKAEKARLLDLYKFVFPEKVKAADEIMSVARPLIEDINFLYQVGQMNTDKVEERRTTIQADLTRLNTAITSNAWIMGSGVETASKQLVFQFRQVLNSTDVTRLYRVDHDDKMIRTISELTRAVRAQVHLDDLPLTVPASVGGSGLYPSPNQI